MHYKKFKKLKNKKADQDYEVLVKERLWSLKKKKKKKRRKIRRKKKVDNQGVSR